MFDLCLHCWISVQSTVFGKGSGLSSSSFWANPLYSMWGSGVCDSRLTKSCFHPFFYFHAVALLSETNSCFNWYTSENLGSKEQMVNLNLLANSNGSWLELGNSSTKAQSPGCICKHWGWFTSPWNNFLFKATITTSEFLNPPLLGKGERQEEEELEEKKVLASGQVIQIEEDR